MGIQRNRTLSSRKHSCNQVEAVMHLRKVQVLLAGNRFKISMSRIRILGRDLMGQSASRTDYRRKGKRLESMLRKLSS